jgi:drug/metabolite transporter (DMT)-like permease
MANPGPKVPILHPGLLFVVVAWALNFCIVRVAYREWTPAALMLVRYLGTMPFMFLLAAGSGAKLSAPLKKWPGLLFAGMLASGVYMVLFLEGMQRTGAAQGAVTMATAPLFIALISFFLGGEKASWRWGVGSLVAFAGVALTHWEGLQTGQGTVTGFLLVLVASAVWAVSVHVIRPLVAELGSIEAMTLSLPGAMLVMAPYAGPGLMKFDFSSLTWVGWGALAYLIVVSGSLAFVAYYRAVQDLGAATASLTQYLIPPTAALFAVVVLGDQLHLLQVAGLALALCGVWIAQHRPAPAAPPT